MLPLDDFALLGEDADEKVDFLLWNKPDDWGDSSEMILAGEGATRATRDDPWRAKFGLGALCLVFARCELERVDESSANVGDACMYSVVADKKEWSEIEMLDSPAGETGDAERVVWPELMSSPDDTSNVVLVGVDTRLNDRRDTKEEDAVFNVTRAELDADRRLEAERDGAE